MKPIIIFAPAMTGRVWRTLIIPERIMLISINVVADVLWVNAMSTPPQNTPASGFLVQRAMSRRTFRPLSIFRCSVSMNIPTKNRPIPARKDDSRCAMNSKKHQEQDIRH